MPSGQYCIETYTHHFNTDGEIDIINLTETARQYLGRSDISEGRLQAFVNGSTGAIGFTEYEPRLIKDNKRIMREIVPKGAGYNHDKIDNNAHSHLRATIIGSEKVIPISENKLMLGTWQQLVFFDFDVRPRNRTVIFQISGIKT